MQLIKYYYACRGGLERILAGSADDNNIPTDKVKGKKIHEFYLTLK